MTREELETANQLITDDIDAKISARNDLDLEIRALQRQRLDNTKEINRLLRKEIEAQT